MARGYHGGARRRPRGARLRLSSRPPKAGVPFPPELGARLAEATTGALTADAASDRWAAVVEALAFSPIHAGVTPAAPPTQVTDELRAVVKGVGSAVPQIATLLEVEVAPPGRRTGRSPRPPRRPPSGKPRGAGPPSSAPKAPATRAGAAPAGAAAGEAPATTPTGGPAATEPAGEPPAPEPPRPASVGESASSGGDQAGETDRDDAPPVPAADDAHAVTVAGDSGDRAPTEPPASATTGAPDDHGAPGDDDGDDEPEPLDVELPVEAAPPAFDLDPSPEAVALDDTPPEGSA